MATVQRNRQIPKSLGYDSPSVAKTLLLQKIYYGNTAGARRGPKALHAQAKRQGHKEVTLADCKAYLRTQLPYTRYRPARRRYARNPIVSYFCGEVVQIDIMDMQWCREENDGYLYSLLSYDTYSKYLTSYPMKSRSTESIINGLRHLVDNLPFSIVRLYSDQEASLLAKRTKAWLKGQDILLYTTTSQVKAPNVERVIRTIRTALARFFESTGTLRWIDHLPNFVSSYNNRDHSTTKHRPLDLVNDPMLLVTSKHLITKDVKLPPIGSYVRLNKSRGIFEKESKGGWTTEVFRVIGHKQTTPIPMITLEDLLGETIAGSFYPEEYQEVEWDGKKEVDQVFRIRNQRGVKEGYVSYADWPNKFNEWIPIE